MRKLTLQTIILSDGSRAYNVLIHDRDETVVLNATTESHAHRLLDTLTDAIDRHTCNEVTYAAETVTTLATLEN